jgi:hypothetical protein
MLLASAFSKGPLMSVRAGACGSRAFPQTVELSVLSALVRASRLLLATAYFFAFFKLLQALRYCICVDIAPSGLSSLGRIWCSSRAASANVTCLALRLTKTSYFCNCARESSPVSAKSGIGSI